jgi:hypothetical protein
LLDSAPAAAAVEPYEYGPTDALTAPLLVAVEVWLTEELFDWEAVIEMF